MAHQAVPETALLRALDSLGPYVVLRNHDVLAQLATGGDIDLLVLDPRHAERQLVADLGAPLFVERRSYVTGLFYDWGHIDLLPSLQWRGATYLDRAAVLQDRELSPFGLPRPRLAHEAVVSWFSSLLWGGFFKPRYRDVIIEAVRDDGEELARVLHTAVGKRWARRLWLSTAQGRPEESELWAGQLRRAVVRRALARAPLQTIIGRLRFYLAEARLHLNPPLPWMAVLGPDGSGKSTLLAGLRDSWPQSLGPVHIHHLRPGRLARRRGSPEPVVDPHGQPPRGTVTSIGALIFVTLDWWIGYWTWIVRQRARLGLVVFDRHLLDVLVDPMRYRYGGPSWLARAACNLVPRPDVIVVLDAPAVVVRARKQEVTPAESERQSLAYRRLAVEVAGAHLVDAAVAPEQVLEAVTSAVRRHMLKRPAPAPQSRDNIVADITCRWSPLRHLASSSRGGRVPTMNNGHPGPELVNDVTSNRLTASAALLRVWQRELWAGTYYRRRPLAAAQLLYARWLLSRANPRPADPRTFLAALGIEPQDALADFETWRHTLFRVVELSEQEDDSIGVTAAEGMVLYGLVRALRPEYVIETGIATGVSTSFISAALIENGFGNLYSIDLPSEESTGVVHSDGSHSVLRGPGWAVPDTIRAAMQGRHEILLEDVRTSLPKLLARLPRVDFFLHDDLHTPDHMYWEYNLVWPRLSIGGALVSDDINFSWLRFCRSTGVGKRGHRNLQRLGVILKS